jgi:hypothetical protein
VVQKVYSLPAAPGSLNVSFAVTAHGLMVHSLALMLL